MSFINNITGQVVRTLVDEPIEAGYNMIVWNCRNREIQKVMTLSAFLNPTWWLSDYIQNCQPRTVKPEKSLLVQGFEVLEIIRILRHFLTPDKASLITTTSR